MLLLPCVTPYCDERATVGVPAGGGLDNGVKRSAGVSNEVTRY
jgi:hypothetical protein